LPFGVDDPFAPIANVVRNSFWIGVALVVLSVFRDPGRMKNDALPILALSIQVFAGEVLFVTLAAFWHAVHLPHENSASVLLLVTFLGQLLAYTLRKAGRRVLPTN